jgi:hypothetical protein
VNVSVGRVGKMTWSGSPAVMWGACFAVLGATGTPSRMPIASLSHRRKAPPALEPLRLFLSRTFPSALCTMAREALHIDPRHAPSRVSGWYALYKQLHSWKCNGCSRGIGCT